MAFFMEECPNAYHRWSTRALPTAITYQGLLQQKNKNIVCMQILFFERIKSVRNDLKLSLHSPVASLKKE